MPSQFFGLNIGASALSAFQTSVNTAANNVANVQTKGYTRQTANLSATDPIRVYTRYGSVGTGVEVTSVTQERNLYYDEKYWQSNSSRGFFEQKLYYVDQVQTIFRDDEQSQKGFSSIFSQMFKDLDTLKTQGEVKAVRNQFIHQAQSLCTYFNALSKSLTEIQEDTNEEIKASVDNINSIAEKISVLNKQINNIEVRGGHANELRDQRANLIDELSGIADVETKEFEVTNSNGQNLGGTNYRVYINGQTLVDGNDYRTLKCTSSKYLNNQMDAEGMYAITWEDTGMEFNAKGASANGSLKALFMIRDGNNNENMKGTVSDADLSSITIKIPDTKVNELSLANKGRIMVNNKFYYYDGWTAKVGENGVNSVTFKLAPESQMADQAEADRVKGDGQSNYLTTGSSMDAMGIPYYQNQINEFLRNFTQAFNDIEKQGVTLDGDKMGAFFVGTSPTGNTFDADSWDAKVQAAKKAGWTKDIELSSDGDSYYQFTATTLAVNSKSLKDPNYFATSTQITQGEAKYDTVEDLLKLQKDVRMFRGDSAETFLETLISDVTVDVNKTTTSSNNYSNLSTAIATQRTSVSGVDEDEEAMNLIKFQNAYNLASKVISVMSEMYDKLINETGVV